MNLKAATAAFAVAFGVHGADHVRRGLDVVQPRVLLGGTLQGIFLVVVLVMVLREHRSAATSAMWLGFGSAILFAQAHLLPQWGPLGSDSFLSAPGVTWFSWVTAVLEIGMGFVLGTVAARAMRGVTSTTPAR